MAWSLTPASMFAFLAAGCAAVPIALTWRREEPSARAFAALSVALGAWSLVYGVQLGFASLPAQVGVQRLSMAVSATVPVLWLAFVLTFAGADDWASTRRLALLAVEPAVFGALTLTNPSHGLVWRSASLSTAGPVRVAALDLGPAYVAHIVIAYLFVLAGLWVLVSLVRRTGTVYRNQVSLLLGGAAVPFLAHVAFSLRVSPVPDLDLTPFTFALTGAVFGASLFHFDLLERTPVARKRAIEAMGDGLVVADASGTVVDANDVARRVLDSPVVGRSVESVFDVASPTDVDGQTFARRAEDGARRRTFDCHCEVLSDSGNRASGYVVALQDVTEREAKERRLAFANRVLRHNLRNDLNVVTGFAAELEDVLDGPEREHARTVRERGEALVETSEKPRTLINLRDSEVGPRAVDAVAVIESVLAERPPDDDADVVVDAPERAPVEVPDERHLASAVENLVENAVEHNDGPTPHVLVEVERDDAVTHVRVTDDGPGLPATERAAIERGRETAVDHADGVGLWLAYWSVRTAGGDVSVSTGDDGTTVTVTVPAVAES